MNNNNNDFNTKGADTGAGASFPYVEGVAPTPPASVLEGYPADTQQQPQQEQYTAVDMSQQGYSNGFAGFGLSSALGMPSAPVYIKLQEDPEEVKSRKIANYISIGVSVFFIFLILSFSFSLAGGGSSITGSSKTQHLFVDKIDVKFSDVQGCDEVKLQLERIVKYLKDPSLFEKFGAKMPRGYLLAGPPGVGKTMLAKAVAGESGVPFITISGAEFEEMLVGVGASRVRSLFRDARSHKKAVIFIDEIDAIAGKRKTGGIGENSYSRQTINQLLVEMDGFKNNSGLVILAATNDPDSLDPAILRPGRFDKVFMLTPPDLKGRAKLLTELIKTIPEDKRAEGNLKNLELMWLAKVTVGYTGADLANLVNQAKLIASAEDDCKIITVDHFFKAKAFVELGPERAELEDKSDNERTAHHEAGHAIIGLINQATSDEIDVEYATIVPHGNALGLVTTVPQRDLHHQSLQMLKNRMDLCLGGFTGEKLFYAKDSNSGDLSKVSTGAASDLDQVNLIARAMVEAGFGKNTGFLRMPQNPLYSSEEFKKNFEVDMKEFIEESKKRVEEALKNHKTAWKKLAQELLAKKTLDKSQIKAIFDANKPGK